jgi:formylglycine-generating enzyme required for sulfatase activity
MEFVLIPAGEFVMGSSEAERQAALSEQTIGWARQGIPAEGPQHKVKISRPFYLGKYEVTQAQWQAVMGNNPSQFQGPMNPVEKVSWEDIQPFLVKLNALGVGWDKRSAGPPTAGPGAPSEAGGTRRATGVRHGVPYHTGPMIFALPTEAQWEYACRAGTTTVFCFGDNAALLNEYGWSSANAGGKTHPVGQRKSNAWGLFDMHGNVWEWCADWFAGDYAQSPPVDPVGPPGGSQRVIRGGGWIFPPGNCRAAFRYSDPPGIRNSHRGFRAALIVPADAAADAAKPAQPEPRKPVPAWSLPAGAPPPAIGPFDARKAKEHQIAWAKYLGVQVEMENSIGMKFVLIPPGEFDMGSTEAEVAKLLEEAKATKQWSWHIDDLHAEAPKHRVRITKPFWLSRHEVTRGQFRRFADDRGYKTSAERDRLGGSGFVDGQWKLDPRFAWNRDLGFEQADDHPVVNVTWDDVTAFCTWLSEKEGEISHLPTEAQWEYACRAGTTTVWYSGNDEGALKDHGWFKDNAGQKAHPVGQKSPNAWGLYDMHGNVWEWCRDWWGDRYYATSPTDDPPGASEGSFRVCRGGCWIFIASYGRASFRCSYGPRCRDGDHGYRLARTVSFPSPSR